MRIVITGGAGFLGTRLARKLLERGTLVDAGGRQQTISALVLLDVVPPATAWNDKRVSAVTGDGLPDRLTLSGTTLFVGINKGNGFAADVDWGGASVLGLTSSANIGVGAGVYFTIGIGPLCLAGCYLIVNPGVDGSSSMSRQETMLVDVDGDGYLDGVSSTDDSSMTVSRNLTGKTNLLKAVTRPLGFDRRHSTVFQASFATVSRRPRFTVTERRAGWRDLFERSARQPRFCSHMHRRLPPRTWRTRSVNFVVSCGSTPQSP